MEEQVVPDTKAGHRPTMGSVGLVAADDEAYDSTGEPWGAPAS